LNISYSYEIYADNITYGFTKKVFIGPWNSLSYKYVPPVVIIKVDIVGGSISGLSTAIALKQYNKSIKAVVHEKYKTIGYNREGRRCGEAHSVESEWKKWKPKGKSIFNEITKIETIIGKKRHILIRKPGTSCILNRQEFICQLSRQAEKLDVIIQTDDKIKTISSLDGDYIIDASGCPSSIKRELGFDKGIKGLTYQQTLEDSNCFVSDTVKIVFTESFGYYWIFPRNSLKKEINFGMGLIGNFKCNLKKMLEEIKEEQEITGKVNYVTGGLIPLGLQRPSMYKNILFVGDAGVGTFSFTGQGIYRALISGDIAGKCIAKNIAKKYPYIINQKFIKWDLIGKMFLQTNRVLKRIRPELVLTSYNYFILRCMV
jgi:flavin-dependent dehydrogenase